MSRLPAEGTFAARHPTTSVRARLLDRNAQAGGVIVDGDVRSAPRGGAPGLSENSAQGGAGTAAHQPGGPLWRLGERWGRVIAAYAGKAVVLERTSITGRENVPEEACVWATWHGNVFMALRCHQILRPERRYVALRPPGIVGATMTGWLVGCGCAAPIDVPADGTGNVGPAMKECVRHVRAGRDMVIAPDGPHGPNRVARPGAWYLAHLGRAPLVPVGAAARPAVRYPRWDRHAIPLPRAKVVLVIGEPFVPRQSNLDLDEGTAALADALAVVQARAEAALSAPVGSGTSP